MSSSTTVWIPFETTSKFKSTKPKTILLDNGFPRFTNYTTHTFTVTSCFTGVGIAVEAGSSTVRVHVRIVADTFALRRPHLTQVRRRLHVPTVCSIHWKTGLVL